MNASRTSNTAIIAEPDRLVRLSLSSVLRNEGWRVLATESAAEAFEYADTLRPDLAMVDLEPLVVAEALCAGLRIRYGPKLPIVGLAQRDTVARRQCLASRVGVVDTLTMPFELGRLQALLDRAHRLQERTASIRDRSETAILHLHAARRLPAFEKD
jgi:DNA-binding response OmpR family regulator